MPIYKNPVSAINEEAAVLFEATGFETAKFIKKDKVPDNFKKIALKVIDHLESEGKRVSGGKNETIGDAFRVFGASARKSVEKHDKSAAYYFVVPAKIKLVALKTPQEYKEYGDKVFKAVGFKCGQEVEKLNNHYYYIKDKTTDGDPCYFLAWISGAHGAFAIEHQMAFVLQCVERSENSTAFIESGGDVSSEMINHTEDQLTPNTLGFEGLSPEELYGFTPDLGLTRSEELSKNSSYGNFFRDPKIMSAFTEHLDLSDSLTRKAVLAMNEAEQGSVLTSLTSKLYDNIISKIDDIDYGEIPSTKGDITKLSNYEKLNECVELLRKILIEFKQDTKPIDEIATAISNVSTNKDIFIKGYKFDCELPIVMYNNTVLTIISAVSYMIATCIEFIKTPNQDTFQITLDKMAYAKTKQNMLYNNLKKFNKCCKSGDMQKAMNHILQNKVKRFVEGAAVGVGAAIIGALGVAGVIAIVMNIIPILREMVFFFYYTRMRVSDFFDIQADLLQMNAYNLENDMNKDAEKKERIVSKQLKIVELFRKIANKISFTGRKAEIEATKDIANTSKKMKLNDVTDELPDSVSALF